MHDDIEWTGVGSLGVSRVVLRMDGFVEEHEEALSNPLHCSHHRPEQRKATHHCDGVVWVVVVVVDYGSMGFFGRVKKKTGKDDGRRESSVFN